MAKYFIRYMIEWGGTSFWGMNEIAQKSYNYPIQISELPLSEALKTELYQLEAEYQTALDWDYPPNPSPWTEKHKKDFDERAHQAYERVKVELGRDYDGVYDVKIVE